VSINFTLDNLLKNSYLTTATCDLQVRIHTDLVMNTTGLENKTFS